MPSTRVAFVAVAARAIDQIGAGKLAVVRRRVGEVIVRRDEHERHLLDRGDVHPFMARAGLHAAFADRRQADETLLALHALRHQRADDHRNHRAEMADHRELTILADGRDGCCRRARASGPVASRDKCAPTSSSGSPKAARPA